MRIVEILNPTWLLIENVPRLLSIHEGRDFAVVLQTLSESGYGYAWRILDSQYFGVPQRRRRIFIVGRFGRECPAEILFEPKSNSRDDKKKRKIRSWGLCISARDGERQDPTSETYITSTIQGTDKKLRKFGFGENCIASTIQASDYRKTQHGQFGNEGNLIASAIHNYPEEKLPPSQNRQTNLIAQTITAKSYGDKGWTSPNEWNSVIAEINPNGKRETSRSAKGLDSLRGILIGNAVTVQVAEWIAKRIYDYEIQSRNK
jgi:site-specific DNA-cytosine methylase